MSTRLYFDDMYQKTFSATVQHHRLMDGKAAVSLNETLFYPTSGGQMHDTGWINGVPVLDVQLLDEEIWHILARPLAEDQVTGELDWARRFDFMQQHTAFHILAGSCKKLLNIDTLASHLGEMDSTIEIDAEECVATELNRLEEFANQVIYENRPVRAFFVEQAEWPILDLRKTPSMNGPIRLVEIENLDIDPCGGTHVNGTGQVGMIKVTGQERIRGHLRLSFVAGKRCWREMSGLQDLALQLAGRFSTRLDALVAAVDKMQAENRDLRKKMYALSRSLAENALQEITSAACAQTPVVRKYGQMSNEDLRWLASTALKRKPGIYLLANESQSAAFVFSSSDHRVDLRKIIQKILPMMDGKGGGDVGFVQGAGPNTANLDRALQQAKLEIEQLLTNDDSMT